MVSGRYLVYFLGLVVVGKVTFCIKDIFTGKRDAIVPKYKNLDID